VPSWLVLRGHAGGRIAGFDHGHAVSRELSVRRRRRLAGRVRVQAWLLGRQHRVRSLPPWLVQGGNRARAVRPVPEQLDVGGGEHGGNAVPVQRGLHK